MICDESTANTCHRYPTVESMARSQQDREGVPPFSSDWMESFWEHTFPTWFPRVSTLWPLANLRFVDDTL